MIGKDLIDKKIKGIPTGFEPIIKSCFDIEFKNEELKSIEQFISKISLPTYSSLKSEWTPAELIFREVIGPNASYILWEYLINEKINSDLYVIIKDKQGADMYSWELIPGDYEIDFGYFDMEDDSINYVSLKIFPKSYKRIK